MSLLVKKICNEVVRRYKRDKNVLGILLFGSAVRGNFDAYSDVDFYIVVRKRIGYSRLNFLKWERRVDVLPDTVKQIYSYLKEERKSVRRSVSHMLAHGIVLYARTKEVGRIQSAAKKNLTFKTKYKKGELLMHKYSIDDFWNEAQRDFKNQDCVAFGIDSQLLLNNIIELFLKLHGEFWRQSGEMLQLISRIDRELGKQVGLFYKADTMETKKKILAKLVTYTYKKSGGPLPKEWALETG